MGLWVCRRCTAKFAVGLSCCPQCTGTKVYEDGSEDEMAKTTVHGGATDAVAEAEPATEQESGEQEWDGTSSSASTEKPPTNGEPSSPSDQSPAPTTEPSSKTDQTESGSAASTDGANADADRRAEYEDWTKPDLQDELERRDLPITGNKPELVDRLLDHDAADA